MPRLTVKVNGIFSIRKFEKPTIHFWVCIRIISLRVHEKINLQFWELRRPAVKARKLKEYQAYFEFSQRCQTGCIGIQNMKLFLSEPLARY